MIDGDALPRLGGDEDLVRGLETLLLVGDIRDAVVVTSALYLRKFLLALRKRFVVEGWIPS